MEPAKGEGIVAHGRLAQDSLPGLMRGASGGPSDLEMAGRSGGSGTRQNGSSAYRLRADVQVAGRRRRIFVVPLLLITVIVRPATVSVPVREIALEFCATL